MITTKLLPPPAPGEGESGYSVFRDIVRAEEHFVRMVLAAGTVAVAALVALIFFPGKDHHEIIHRSTGE